MTRVHATAVAIGRRGVLIRGKSGSGKSDLALRLIDGGAKLIADDVVDIVKRGGALGLYPPSGAPRSLKGKMEVRGLGIVAVPSVRQARLTLVVDLVGAGRVERYPESIQSTFLGIRIKHLKLHAFEASTAAKVRLAVAGL
jgi:HPr kinase/phosphorylase